MYRRPIALLCLLSYLLGSAGLLQELSVARLAEGAGHRAFAEAAPRGAVYYLHHAGHADRHEKQSAADQCSPSSCPQGHGDHVIGIEDHADAVPLAAADLRKDKARAVLATGVPRPAAVLSARYQPPSPPPEPLVRSSRPVLIRSTILLI